MNAAAPALPRSPAGPFNPWMVALMLSIAPFMELLDSTIANVSLTHIAGSLGASQQESTWILTSYLVSNTIVLPISGWLARVIGRKLFYQICVGLFTISSVLCAFSTSLEMIVVARCLQGIGGAGLAPVTQSMLADSFPPEKRGQVFALFGLTVVAAPATGPFVGGLLTDHLSWHWIFLINLPIGLVATTLIAIFVSEPPLLVLERKEFLKDGLRLDYLGLFLVAAGFGALQMFLDKFVEDDGFSSPFIVASGCLCIASLSLLVVWEWNHPRPVMNFRLFRFYNFAVGNILLLVLGFVMLSATQLLPQMTQSVMGYDSTTSGQVLGFSSIATIAIMPLAGFVTGRFIGPKWLVIGAFAEIGFALLLQSRVAPDVSFGDLAFNRVLMVAALPFLFVPINTVSYIGIPPRNNGEASALVNQMRNLGGSIGISFGAAMVSWRTQVHHARLAEAITPYSSLHGMTISQIAQDVQNQAAFMSYLDMFRIVGIMSLLVCPVALLLRSPRRPAAQGVTVAH